MYRESEAQTDPYAPDYNVRPGNNPEVLNITYFTYGSGLPASMAEMELIEQSRERRLFESMLPSTTDNEACFLLRRRLMEEQELKEWQKRENDIKKIQGERLSLLQSALIDRERENEDQVTQRVEEIRLKKTEQKDRALAKIGRRRIKVLRKMFKERKKMDKTSTKRDITDEYGNFGSAVYAGVTREGMSLDKLANKYEVQPEVLTTYQGLSELAYGLPDKILNTVVNIKTETKRIAKSYTRRDQHHKNALQRAQKAISDVSIKKVAKAEETQAAAELAKDDDYRPDTPAVPRPDSQYSEQKTTAIMLLQRLIRGRAIQQVMQEGKEKRLDLIAELRGTGEMIETSENEQERQLLLSHIERVLEGAAEAIQGSVIADTIDSLSKELVRLKQERKVAAMVRLAEEARRRKECEESGRRQAEAIRKDREDALFREIMSTNQGTVDGFLQGAISNAVDLASEQQAYEEAYLRTFQINRIVDNLEERANKPEIIAKDLLSAFLIPEVKRQTLRRQLKLEEKKHMLAARKVLLEATAKSNAGYRDWQDEQREAQSARIAAKAKE